jgi:hypothetical protein
MMYALVEMQLLYLATSWRFTQRIVLPGKLSLIGEKTLMTAVSLYKS